MQKTACCILVILSMLFLAHPEILSQNRDRSEIPDKYKWDLTHLYVSDQAWQEAKDKVSEKIEEFDRFKGRLAQSSSNLLDCLEFSTEILKEMRRLSSYSWNKNRQDLRESKYQAMDQKTNQLNTKYNAHAAFIQPEILALNNRTIHKFMEEEPGLQPYTFYLNDLMRRKKHILSDSEEKVIAEAGGMLQSPSSIYSTLINVDLAKMDVTLSTGETIELNQPDFGRHRSTAHKEDRELINRTYYNALHKWQSTFGSLMNAKVNADLFNTRVRGYTDCLEMTLEPNNIPVAVFYSFIDNANKNLDKFHRYLKIRKRLLGADELEYTNLSVPTFRNFDLNYDIEEAKDLILDSLKPLGKAYTSIVKKVFESRWIDFYPTPGKRSNGYTDPGAYAEHPYVLTNYSGKYQDVSTLAHELGHVLHRYLTDRSQPFPTSNYASFIAEVAAIFNEKLLINEVLKNTKDDETRLYLLMNSIDRTLFDRAQVSEFEWRIHQEVEKGNALTGDRISTIYPETLRKYYGHDQGICHVPDYFDIRWIFERLLFINTYRVYVYATSQIVTTTLAEKVLVGEKGAVRKYLDFLSAGGSDYPINLLKKAGVDLTSPEPFVKTMEMMSRVMDEIERILEKNGR
ncbi:MAG: oligoendopeptidase F [Candidatus Aminicenantes bacterium]|nr:MAG: oligoendopeptidase F [Candidatus Aminicenantes bacterium]